MLVASGNGGPRAAASLEDVAALHQEFSRNRELMIRVLRKSATLEDNMTVMKDDLIRKDVIIHNLRQEVQTHQTEAQVQHQNFEQQQQQLQQQHQMQQLQQLQQLQELQRLLQQQHLHQQQQQLQAQPMFDGQQDPLMQSLRSENGMGDEPQQ